MPTATPIALNVGGWPGPDASIYRLDPPLVERNGKRHDHVVVYVTPDQPRIPSRAVVIGCDEFGNPTEATMRQIAVYAAPFEPNHGAVLWLCGGYEVGEPDIPAEPEPGPPEDGPAEPAPDEGEPTPQ